MKNQNVIKIGWIFITLSGLTVGISSCDKPGVPSDHTIRQGTALHKPGLENPYRQESGCSATNCHHSDLRGGPADVDEDGIFESIAPSCYQCHGQKWDD